MTAEVLSLDGARVSARHVLHGETLDVARVPGMILAEHVDRLRREVAREAEKQFGDLPQTEYVYLTAEVVAAFPEPEPAA